MKKYVVIVMVSLISVFLFGGSALSTNIGELEENLKICAYDGCVRPILIYSIDNKIDIYITGEMVKSARLTSQRTMSKKSMRPENQDFFYFEGGLYFDYKDKASRETAINKIKTIIRTHDENMKRSRETGEKITYPETEDSYFWGSLVGGHLVWGYSGPSSSQVEKIDNFRFLTMRIAVTFPISREDFAYDTTASKLIINRRCFHSAKPLKINPKDKPFIGLVDPRSSMSLSSGVGAILLNLTPDQYYLKRQDTPKDIIIFQDIIKNIAEQIFKTRDSFSAPKSR